MLSELRRPKGDPAARRAVAACQDEDLFISVVSLGEIVKGIALLRDSRKKRNLQTWLETLERHYSDRILGIDLETSHIWGEITAAAQKSGRSVPVSDGLIAATAHRHALHVMTRNSGHFQGTGALLVNPWVEENGG